MPISSGVRLPTSSRPTGASHDGTGARFAFVFPTIYPGRFCLDDNRHQQATFGRREIRHGESVRELSVERRTNTGQHPGQASNVDWDRLGLQQERTALSFCATLKTSPRGFQLLRTLGRPKDLVCAGGGAAISAVLASGIYSPCACPHL